MRLRAARRKRSRHANDDALAGLEDLGEVDLVAWVALEEVDVGDRVAGLDHGAGCAVEVVEEAGVCEAQGLGDGGWLEGAGEH